MRTQAIQKKINNYIISWLVFYTLEIIGLSLLACVILFPLLYDNDKLIFEYNLVSHQYKLLKQANQKVVSRSNALGNDTQFTEHVVRKELNLRKPKVETIKVSPVSISIQTSDDKAANPFILSELNKWYIKPFLEEQTRLWIFVISIGLILTGIIFTK